MKLKGRRRGIALVFAMFTTVVLITMSATVVALAIRHGQTGTSTNHAESALHAANWGIEATLNYMGTGANWEYNQNITEPVKESFHVKPQHKQALGGAVTVRVTKLNEIPPDVVGGAVGDVRQIEFYDAANTAPYKVIVDGNQMAKVTVKMTEIRITNQPSHYHIVSTAEIQTPTGSPLATRVVETRVREQSALDFMHFIQNAKAWDVSGVNPGDAKAKSIVGMPEGYEEKGKIRVDGGGSVADTAGTLKFYGRGDTDATRWKFDGEATIAGSKDSVEFATAGADKDLNKIFGGGLKASAQSLGLPQKNGYGAHARNKAVTGASANNKFAAKFTIGGNSSNIGTSTDGTGVPDVAVPAGNDARPSFAKIEVTLDGNNVTIRKVNGSSSKQLYTGPASGINNGVIAVEGGNVEVKQGANPWTGRLTINADDVADRATPEDGSTKSYPLGGNSIYADSARAYFEDNPHVKPPYTARQITGNPQADNSKKFWPPPAAEVEREGNVQITSDLTYGAGGSEAPSLGLISQNFVLLNDKQGDNNLRVDAVLMSLEHSVQFDWDNQAGNPNHDKLMVEGVQRSFELNGSIIGGFLDVEGDSKKRGYYKQKFAHDDNLRFQLPPAFPRWDKTTSTASGIAWNWVIMNYVDKGTLNQF